METPAVPGMVGAPGGMTPDQWHADKAAREMYERNRPLSDEELDAMLPGAEQVRRAGAGVTLAQQLHCVAMSQLDGVAVQWHVWPCMD
jgi:hypothetical protein